MIQTDISVSLLIKSRQDPKEITRTLIEEAHSVGIKIKYNKTKLVYF